MGEQELRSVTQGGNTVFWQRAIVGVIVASVVGGVFALFLAAQPQNANWNELALPERSLAITSWYILEPLLLGLYVFLVGPLIAWALARRYAPSATPSAVIVCASALLANLAAAALVAVLHLRISDGALALHDRLMDVLVRIAVLFCGGVLSTFVLPHQAGPPQRHEPRVELGMKQ